MLTISLLTLLLQVATVSGWGVLEEGGALSPSLQEVKVTVTSNAQCKLVWNDKVGE